MQGYNSHRGTTVYFLVFSFFPEIYNHYQINFFPMDFQGAKYFHNRVENDFFK